MIDNAQEIRNHAYSLFNWYKNQWDNNYLLSRRFREDNIYEVIKLFNIMQDNFTNVKKVAICHTSDCTGLLYMLQHVYKCEVVVITNHPLMERIMPFYNKTFPNVSYVKANCIFDDITPHLKDCDVVMFPEMEYFIPLYMMKNYNQRKKTVCFYYVDDFNSVTNLNNVMCLNDMDEVCSFDTTIEIGKFKNTNGFDCFYGLGIL